MARNPKRPVYRVPVSFRIAKLRPSNENKPAARKRGSPKRVSSSAKIEVRRLWLSFRKANQNDGRTQRQRQQAFLRKHGRVLKRIGISIGDYKVLLNNLAAGRQARQERLEKHKRGQQLIHKHAQYVALGLRPSYGFISIRRKSRKN